MKKRLALGVLGFLPVLLLSACILGSDDEAAAVSTWLSEQGLPENYKVGLLEIPNVSVKNFKSYRDESPINAYGYGTVGASAGLTHDLYLDFAFNFKKGDTAIIQAFKKNDSSTVALRLYPEADLYKSAFLKDSVPFKETLDISVSWIFQKFSSARALDSLVKTYDTTWYKTLGENFEPDETFDSSYTISVRADSAVFLKMPESFVKTLQEVSFGGRVQLKLSAPKAKRAYRFSGYGNVSRLPAFKLASHDSTLLLTPFREAVVIYSESGESQDGVLYGGVQDSLVFELDGDQILKALSEFYGDEFPWKQGNGMDVRQAVVLAQFAFPKNDAAGFSEFGLPIQTVVSSFKHLNEDQIADKEDDRRDELYKLNRELIKKSGHPNLIFYEGDSLYLQATYGMRDFINRASETDELKLMLRLGYPVLEPKDTIYSNYINAEGDTIFFFSEYFDYAKYDFSSALEGGVNLKLWLASKRGAGDAK